MSPSARPCSGPGRRTPRVREAGLRVKSDGGYREVAVEVIPLTGHGGAKEGGFLILFEEARPPRSAPPHAPPADRPADPDDARLARELAATREYLLSVIERQEAANEELQSANEEVQSANEELQSTNEELETSKEKIQWSNEELATVNDELNRVNNDLVSIPGSVQMPIVMLGPDLRVRRFTPAAEKLLNLIPTAVGRPLADIRLNLDDLPDSEPLLAEVLDTVGVKEVEVRDKHGRWYSLRLRPYKTLDNKTDGVILVFVDVDGMKRATFTPGASWRRRAGVAEVAGERPGVAGERFPQPFGRGGEAVAGLEPAFALPAEQVPRPTQPPPPVIGLRMGIIIDSRVVESAGQPPRQRDREHGSPPERKDPGGRSAGAQERIRSDDSAAGPFDFGRGDGDAVALAESAPTTPATG